MSVCMLGRYTFFVFPTWRPFSLFPLLLYVCLPKLSSQLSVFSSFPYSLRLPPLLWCRPLWNDPCAPICGSNLDLVLHIQPFITHFRMCIMHGDMHSWLKSICYARSLGRRGAPSALPPLQPWHMVPLVQSQNYLWFLFLFLPASYWIIHQVFKNIFCICHFFSIHCHLLV